MGDIWNESNLQQPPLIVLPVNHPKIRISTLQTIFDNAINFYENQKDFNEAAALCSRLVIRRKNSFRKMPGFKNMCKLNSALCRLLRVDIKEILKNFQSMIPDYISKVDETYLPPSSCLEYVLIRLISIHKIYQRIIICAKNASKYFVQLLTFNFFQEIVTVFLSVLSQIWKLSQINASKTAKYYEELLCFRFSLPKSKKPWLSQEIIFPDKLDDITESSLPEQQERDEKDTKDLVINFTSSSDLPSSSKISYGKIAKEFKKIHQPIDVGTIVSRDSLRTTAKDERKNIQNICSIDEIRKFLLDEDKQRRKSLKQASTKNISNSEWILIKKRINNKINANKSKTAIKLFKSFVQNKITK